MMVNTGCLSVDIIGLNKKVDVSLDGKNKPVRVVVTQQQTGHVEVEGRNKPVTVSTEIKNTGHVKYRRIDYGMNVTFGIVCRVSLGENGEEMWWCNDWRVDWKDGVPTLWRS